MQHSLNVYREACDVAIEAAWAAARLIRPFAGRVAAQDIKVKGVHDLVTALDEQAQEVIVRMVHRAFPDHSILAEEGTEADFEQVKSPVFQWIIDPIDGTTNFTHGVPPYAVSIGLAHQSEMVMGVVLDVAREELFWAVKNEGAYLNGQRLHVSSNERLQDSLLTTGFPFRAFGHVDLYLDVLREFFKETRGVRRPGVASIDLAYVAAGRFDGFFETGLKPWDVAAGILLVQEAGGAVSDYQGRPNPIFSQQIIASNGKIHEAMERVLYPMRNIRD